MVLNRSHCRLRQILDYNACFQFGYKKNARKQLLTIKDKTHFYSRCLCIYMIFKFNAVNGFVHFLLEQGVFSRVRMYTVDSCDQTAGSKIVS